MKNQPVRTKDVDMNLISKLLEENCPFINGGTIKAGYFGKTEAGYRLTPISAETVVKRYTDGGSMEQYAFLFMPKRYFDSAEQGWEAAKLLYDAFSVWASSTSLQAREESVCILGLEVLHCGFAFEEQRRQFCFRIHCRLLYERCWHAAEPGVLVRRCEKVAFYETEKRQDYRRMEAFTELSCKLNPKISLCKEADVTGYAPYFSYCFDQHRNDPVHTDIVDIHNREKAGDAVLRSVVFVDFTQPIGEERYRAYWRSVVVAPESKGEGLLCCRYSGRLYARGTVVCGAAATADNWNSCIFYEHSNIEAHIDEPGLL